MNPLVRVLVAGAALIGVCMIGRVLLPVARGNLTAAKSWTRTQGEVRAMNGAIEFEIGAEPESYRAFATVGHTWGLSLFKKVPLYVDPADNSRVMPAGVLQMWLDPVEMMALALLLLAISGMAVVAGREQGADTTAAFWMFTRPPGALASGVSLHAPGRQWKIAIGWSTLGIALVAAEVFGGDANRPGGMFRIACGTAFTIALWLLSWHTKTMELSANAEGVRLSSVLGWREVPWKRIRGVEDQHIFTSYYNGDMRMWELPFPGSTARVLAFTNESGRSILTFSPELEPKDALKQLFDLCKQQTGAALQQRDVRLPF